MNCENEALLSQLDDSQREAVTYCDGAQLVDRKSTRLNSSHQD